ncbi:hypothetical protein [Arcanobacterium pinnipediorum]|uniref:MinD-like ATPase involved in chromosome partitioning or flagellar assembly n=1 Tax=Arcanobacterium pinnipediorum TaxID=1503041 RepID=A0ABY5AHJ2_9ACTO|nr:hypothetical protein [Arcanobacterium pinnipediorum]USR79667.1 hypothetical protein NG665_01355 [Arcanobacterium pinnipediorum]
MSVLLCLPAQIDSAVVEMLSESGQTHLIARRCADLAEVLAGARARIASLAIISEDLDFLDLTLISELRQYVGVAVVLNTATDGLHSSQRISSRDLRSLGDVEILSPAPREIVARMQAVHDGRSFSPRPNSGELSSSISPRSPLVAFWGPHGSHGRSSLIRDCAVRLARQHTLRVVDADASSPSLAQFFDVEENSGIIGVARMIDQGKEANVSAMLSDLPPQFNDVELLAGMNTGHRWREISRPVADRMWPILCAQPGGVFVDLAGGLDEHAERIDRWALTRSALASADIVLHIASATPTGLRRLIEHWDATRDQGFTHEAVVLTAVRASALGLKPMFHAREVLHSAGISQVPIFGVRQDYARLDRVLIAGKSMMQAYPKTGYCHDVERVCRWIEDTMQICVSTSH